MLSVAEIRNAKFTKAMGGYKQEEVDILLDKIESDYVAYERLVKDFQSRIEEQNKEIEELKASQASIQNVLLSAQRLADKIVSEAKEKSEEIIKNAESNISIITAREKELSTTFELKAQERKTELEAELAEMVKNAKFKAESITAAAEDSVKRQQLLFDKLKIEISTFKTNISSKYKEHLEILAAIPDNVPSDPEYITKVITTSIDKAPDAESFIKAAALNSGMADIASASSNKSNSKFEINVTELEDEGEEEL